ncbi:hypothetical protein AB1E33_29065 [Ruegeria sp. 2012CJ15-1]
MTRSLFTQYNISRSPLDDRANPSAAVIQNGDVDRIIRIQSVTCLRPSWHNMTAASASKTVDRATVATSASPIGALSP